MVVAIFEGGDKKDEEGIEEKDEGASEEEGERSSEEEDGAATGVGVHVKETANYRVLKLTSKRSRTFLLVQMITYTHSLRELVLH